MRDFKCSTYGKWILAGEHAVLRGVPALVFPVYSCSLNMNFVASEAPLEIEFTGTYGNELRLIFWSVVEKSLKEIGRNRSELTGFMEIENNLAVGAGLGASAAICVGIGRWWMALDWLKEDQLYDFSRNLENLFHGESSGVDIAASLTGQGMRFLRNGDWNEITMNWQPIWYLSYSGQKGITSECVGKVKSIIDLDPQKGLAVDQQMERAVHMVTESLAVEGSMGALQKLAHGISLAEDCFHQWGLIEGQIGSHIDMLKNNGALACKPTGSGGGGYVLSLWKEAPPKELQQGFLSLQKEY